MSTATLQPTAGVSLAQPFRRGGLSQGSGSNLVYRLQLTGYLALGLMAVGFPIPLTSSSGSFGIDGPHVQATITRTYFDKAERARLGWYLWVPVPLLLLGPRWSGGFVFVLLVRGVLAAIPHRQTAFWVHDVVQGQNKDRSTASFSAGPLVAAQFAAHTPRNVCAAYVLS